MEGSPLRIALDHDSEEGPRPLQELIADTPRQSIASKDPIAAHSKTARLTASEVGIVPSDGDIRCGHWRAETSIRTCVEKLQRLACAQRRWA